MSKLTSKHFTVNRNRLTDTENTLVAKREGVRGGVDQGGWN